MANLFQPKPPEPPTELVDPRTPHQIKASEQPGVAKLAAAIFILCFAALMVGGTIRILGDWFGYW